MVLKHSFCQLGNESCHVTYLKKIIKNHFQDIIFSNKKFFTEMIFYRDDFWKFFKKNSNKIIFSIDGFFKLKNKAKSSLQDIILKNS